MVAVARNDDPPGSERSEQFLDSLRREIGLVGDADQRGGRRFWEGAEANRDRAADSIWRIGVLDHRPGQARDRVTESRVGRHDGDDRLKTGLQETARGFPDK